MRDEGSDLEIVERGPKGRHTYVATVGPDGELGSLDQRLTYENAMKLVVGTTTAGEVRELLGPPGLVSHYPRQERHVWEYKWINVEDKRVLWVQFSDDWIVREVVNMHDYESDPPGGRARGRG